MRRRGGPPRGVCVAAIAAVAAVAAGTGAAHAAANPPDQAPLAARDTTEFIPGTAVATSQAFQFDPRDAGLAATITLGRSVAQYRNSLSQASGQILDLGVIGSTLTVQCGVTPPVLKPEQLPKAISAESNAGEVDTKESLGGADNQYATAALGKTHVRSSPPPNEDAMSEFNGARIEVPGVITVRGLASTAHAHLYPGKARVADSTADLGTVQLGPVRLGGLHWETSVRTGTNPASSSTFTVSTVSIGGTKLPTASTTALLSTIKTVNKVLEPTGLFIQLPEVSHDDAQLSMTPLSIGIKHSALGKMLLVPILNLVHTVFDPAADAINKAFCTFGSAYGALNLMIAALDGVGQFSINLGGTTATTDDATYANPFGDGEDDTNPGDGGTVPPVGDTSTPPIGGGGGGPLPTVSSAPVPVPAPQVAGGTETVAASCSTTSPAGRPSCGRGAGLAVGLIALAALGGIAGADYFVVRRRSRLARMAIET